MVQEVSIHPHTSMMKNVRRPIDLKVPKSWVYPQFSSIDRWESERTWGTPMTMPSSISCSQMGPDPDLVELCYFKQIQTCLECFWQSIESYHCNFTGLAWFSSRNEMEWDHWPATNRNPIKSYPSGSFQSSSRLPQVAHQRFFPMETSQPYATFPIFPMTNLLVNSNNSHQGVGPVPINPSRP